MLYTQEQVEQCVCTYDGRHFVFCDIIRETPFDHPTFLMVRGVKDTLEEMKNILHLQQYLAIKGRKIFIKSPEYSFEMLLWQDQRPARRLSHTYSARDI